MRYLVVLLIGILVGGIGVATWLKKSNLQTDATAPVVIPASSPAVETVAAPVPQPSPAITVEVPAPSTSVAEIAPAKKPTAAFVSNDDVPARTLPTDRLTIPVEGITTAQLRDTFNEARGSERRHEALDILASKGTKVVAVADGKIVKLFNSKPGGITLYQFDGSEKFAYYYAHLDSYATGIAEGQVLKRGDLIGYVGSTGNADPSAPHLHFAIFELGPEKQWWKGKPINPFPLLGGITKP